MDIDGTPQADSLDDTSGDDRINGGDGNDNIDVSNGHDEVDGGAGSDLLRIQWEAMTDPITNGTAAAGFDIRLVGGAGRSVDFRGIENVEVQAGNGNDNFTLGSTHDWIYDGPRDGTGNLPTGNDTLGGGGGNDIIDVRNGNDSADGGDGDDLVLIGWSGSTTPVVGAAAPAGFQWRYESGPGRSIDLVGIERISIIGGSADDVITTHGGNDSITDGPETAFDDDMLSSGSGNDSLRTQSGHDNLDGGEGLDSASLFWINSTVPIISVATPNGFDLRFESGPNRSANLVNIESVGIFSGSGNDNVTTGAGNDLFSDQSGGNSGNDVFDGGAGSDAQHIRSGHDKGDGGSGGDIALIDWSGVSTPVVNAVPGAGYDIRFETGSSRSAELKNFESIDFSSGSGADILNFGNTRDTVFGAGGNDAIDGGGGDDVLEGEAGADALNGGAGLDELYGGSGDDDLRGGDGDDFLEGGTGIDTLSGDGGDDAGRLNDDSDSFAGGAGIDTAIVAGNFASFTARLSPDTEVLLLASGTDSRFGTGNASYDYNIIFPNAAAGANAILTVQATGLAVGEDLVFDGSAQQNGHFRIFAGRGVDQLTGGGGNDGFFFDADANGSLTGADRTNGGGGTDTIALRGNYVGAKAVAFAEDSIAAVEVITFLSGHENPYGGPIDTAGFDYAVTMAEGNVAAGNSLDIIGTTLRANESASFDGRAETDGSYRVILGAGDDIVYGGQGADLIHGGLGADQLDGSGGADTYSYRAVLESTAASTDSLALGDGDRIDLGVMDADSGTDGDQAFTFIGDAAFGNVAGQLRVSQSGNIWIVEGDIDGNGIADLVINVTSLDAIVAGDFIP